MNYVYKIIMDTVCRICIGQETNSNESFQAISQEIIYMVEFCTGVLIQKKNGFPSHICSKCLTDVHVAHRLKIKCVDSEKVLNHLLHIKDKKDNINETDLVAENIKIEVNIDYADCNDASVKSDTSNDNSKYLVTSEKSQRKDKKRMKKEIKSVAKRKKMAPAEPIKARGLNKFKRLFCEPCQLKFVDRKESVEHKKRMHKDEQVWICEVCGKSYAHRSSQIAHMRSHYPERYSCHDCDYSTYNKYDLIKHVKIHTGDKSYKCTQCTAAYRTSSNLRAHVRLRHEQRALLACSVCGRTCGDRAALDRHIDAHYHVKRHACELCSARFTKRVYMKNHLLKQHGITMPKVRPGRRKTDVLILRRGGNNDTD